MPGTVYRSRHLRATIREHLADAVIGLAGGTLLALALWFATKAYWLR